jgi:hypothetical protein
MSEIEAFRKALRDAGQPWSRRGVRTIGAGFVAILALNIAMMVGVGVPYAAYVMLALLGVVSVGWVMMIMAMLRRRAWAKAHPIQDIPMPELS